jgi:Tol biopolymer transport system component
MGVYSLHDKAWKLYGDFCSVGSAAFSPDGKKVAFEVMTRAGNPNCNSLPGSEMLLILDLESGQFTPVPGAESVEDNAQLSWSPDGKYLAAEVFVAREDSELHMPYYKGPFQIVSIEIGSWAQKIIADGNGPSWSPKGDWIAYQAPLGQCMLIHPDGTGAKMVLDPSRQRGVWSLYDAIVWSPDGEKLLLNEEQSDTDHSIVTMLDLATGKVTPESKKGPPVEGWVAVRH